MSKRPREKIKLPKYTVLSLEEAIRLIICVAFDVVEYAVPILLTPIVGDVLDIAGVGLGIALFGWLGLISIVELLPLVDYFPVFILMWIVWYYLRKQEEKERLEKLKEKWK